MSNPSRIGHDQHLDENMLDTLYKCIQYIHPALIPGKGDSRLHVCRTIAASSICHPAGLHNHCSTRPDPRPCTNYGDQKMMNCSTRSTYIHGFLLNPYDQQIAKRYVLAIPRNPPVMNAHSSFVQSCTSHQRAQQRLPNVSIPQLCAFGLCQWFPGGRC